ncbi:PREDICTED: probable C-terminal domain small phosphatase [Tarenaya hassleriana]|uniref:probable C-terminal domain small phosphatase n=1 Tax=Tarenaya hassleriana TaxID=28532 RepID=UPI00053C743A|nr:PREDICTED: probable C-terminal domain small phosphatase [Tarenaya hassleriana]
MVSKRVVGKSVKIQRKETKNYLSNFSAASIFTSLNASFFAFHHRLLRCVSRFFRATASSCIASKNGYKKLEKHNKKKRTILLDLDETLVHSTTQPPRGKIDFMVRIKIGSGIIPLFVVKRPGVNEFLKRISEEFRVVVFTAGLEDYASQVLDKLDQNRVISQRLYRDSCKEVNGKYVKDLSLVVGKDLGSVLMVDDNPFSYSFQPENGLPIKPFVDDMNDRELMKLADFFEGCYRYEDMRDAVNEFLSKRPV